MSNFLNALIKETQNKNFKSFSKLLTFIENKEIESLKSSQLLQVPQKAFRIGFTGPPGAGKSTLMNEIVQKLIAQDKTVGIMSVDPSSPFSGGAILADRIRYSQNLLNQNVFFRSVGNRGQLGGLSSSTYIMLKAFDLFQFDFVMVETVGVGQAELEVMYAVDFLSVVLVPESGDSIQVMKSGLMEVADHFIVNKSDRPGAEDLVKELELYLQEQNKTNYLVHPVIATKGEGVLDVVNIYLKAQKRKTQKYSTVQKLQWEARSILKAILEKKVEEKVKKIQSYEDLNHILNENRHLF